MMKRTQPLRHDQSALTRSISNPTLASFGLITILVWANALGGSDAFAQSVSQTAPAPNRNLTVPGRQSPNPNPPRQKPLPGTTAPRPILQATGKGTVEGFVYWDAATVSHTPGNTCTGLAVTVSVGNSSGGKSQAYTPLATLTNNFKYVGQVKAFLVGSNIKTYDVCTYGYDHVPVGPDLRVTVIAETASLSQPAPFSPMSVPAVDPVGPINIINGQCNMLPRIVNPTASDLFSHWGSCQNMAYDVNFMMQPAQQVLNSSGITVSPGTSTHAGMLSNKPPQGMLAPQTGASAQPQSNNGTLLGNREPASGKTDGTRQSYTGGINGDGINDPNKRAITDITNRGTSSPAGVALGNKGQANPQTASSGQTLTNVDVVKMVKAGTPESVIVHSIQSSKKQFDFSRDGVRLLQQAHVSPAVLAAMCDGSVRECSDSTGTGSAPAATPRKEATRPARTALKPIKLATPRAQKRVTNPRLSQQNASIIAVLEQQRQAALQESTAMNTAVGSLASAAPARTAALSTNLRGGVPASGLAPGQTQSATGNLSSNITHAPFFNSTVLTCTNDPTPRVLHVNGGQGPGIFTPEGKYNLYTIVGCSFGQSQSGNSANIFGANGFKANLNIDFWSDNGITAHLDPYLAGVLDQDNVTLVVAPAGKQTIQKTGFRFYAARGMPGPDGSPKEVQLPYNSVPQSNIALFNVTNLLAGFDQLPPNANSNFPAFSFQGAPVAAWIFRYAYEHHDVYAAATAECFINDDPFDDSACDQFYNIGYDGKKPPRPQWQLKSDSFDFGTFASGFQISSYQLYVSELDPQTLCGAWDDYRKTAYLQGAWDYGLTAQNHIVVTWPIYRCEKYELPPSGRLNMADQSAYGLAVWVIGPRCVDPWTGQKDQNCMAHVKQILG